MHAMALPADAGEQAPLQRPAWRQMFTQLDSLHSFATLLHQGFCACGIVMLARLLGDSEQSLHVHAKYDWTACPRRVPHHMCSLLWVALNVFRCTQVDRQCC